MSSRVGYTLAVMLLLIGTGLRIWQLADLPPGVTNDEVTDIRIIETVRQGRIEVFYDLAGEGREGLYHVIVALVTILFGDSIFVYRLVALGAGLITLALVYALTTRLFGPLAGVAAAGLMASTFWMALLARGIGRETLLPLLVAAVLLAQARALRAYGDLEHEPSTVWFAALGGLLGLGFYLHPDNFVIVLMSMVFIAFMVLTRQSTMTRRILSYTNFAILVMVIIAMPYLISTIRLPELSGAGRVFGSYSGGVLRSTLVGVGALGLGGDLNPVHNLPGRPLTDVISFALLLLGTGVALRYWRQPRFALPLVALAALLPPAVLTPHNPDFLSLTALLPVFALFFGAGVNAAHAALPRRARPLVVSGLLALLLVNAGWSASDLFTRWSAQPAVQTAYHTRQQAVARYLDSTAAQVPTVLCSPDPAASLNTDALSSADLILLMSQQSFVLRRVDCGSGLLLLNGGEAQQVVLPDVDTLSTAHPQVQRWLSLGTFVPAADDAILRLEVAAPLADQIGLFSSTVQVRYAPEAPGGSDSVSTPVSLAGNLTFLGYELPGGGSYPPGGIVTLVTYWRIDGEVPRDLRFFAHVLNDPGARPVAQRDTISVVPRQLRSRDILMQITFIELPASIPPGEYSLSVGAYQGADRQRLSVLDNGQPRGDRLFLSSISIGQN